MCDNTHMLLIYGGGLAVRSAVDRCRIIYYESYSEVHTHF
jgi:hypothetical protein